MLVLLRKQETSERNGDHDVRNAHDSGPEVPDQ